MEPSALLFCTGVAILFSGVIFLVLRASKRDATAKQNTAQSLGFSAVQPDQTLLEQILATYPKERDPAHFQMENLFRKQILDGEMYIFDMIDTSGDDSSQVDNQTVAVTSRYLNLPQFTIFPQADLEGWAASIANRVMQLAVKNIGDIIEFPDAPEFGKKYLFTSREPDAARQFFDSLLIRQLENTRLLLINGKGGLFTLTNFDPSLRTANQEALAARIDQAMRVFGILQQGRISS